MAKNKTIFVCQECGYETSGWLGKCPSCNKWNSFVEEKQQEPVHHSVKQSIVKVVGLGEINTDAEERYDTGIPEMDRVLGGGLVKGSLVLVGGDPGIGKSTLLLQLTERIKVENKVLYVSGEESVRQIKIRADRLGVKTPKLSMVSETNLKVIEAIIENEKPQLVIIDSIQTVFDEDLSAAAGSVSQVRAATSVLMRIAKSNGIAMLIVGHVTKEGSLAGPRVLEHMVDTVLYFEGERHLSYRILRAVKNRFGSTNEIGMFEMRDSGLCEVSNPSEMLLTERPEGVPGSAVIAAIEGSRPMLVEIQALVCPTSFGMPRRMSTGLDYNRITLLIAVLEKVVGMQLSNYDAYINVVGGLKLNEPASDLGVMAAIASSFRNIPISDGTIFIGEVGLTGEVRAVSQIEKRIMEAKRTGFKKCIIPFGNIRVLGSGKGLEGIEVKGVRHISEALEHIR